MLSQSRNPWRLPGAALLAVWALACTAAPPPDWEYGEETRVLVVARQGDAVARRLAQRYVAARRIAASHLLWIECPAQEEIDRPEFVRSIEGPIAQWWRECAPDRRPPYVLLLKGIPHKIRGSGGPDGDRASVDSELTSIPRVADGTRRDLRGPETNPYFSAREAGRYLPFDPVRFRICLVTRLDGYDEEDAAELITRSLAASAPVGEFLLDLRGGGEHTGQQWLRSAAKAVLEHGASARLDTLSDFVAEAEGLAGYASWGSNDSAFERPRGYKWLPGALVTTFVSSSARTFHEPSDDWTPGPSSADEHRFEGSTQSLLADWVRSGATGASGNAYEPYLAGCTRPQILFAAALDGRNLAESYYLALSGISWQSVILGDPLCAPYAKSP